MRIGMNVQTSCDTGCCLPDQLVPPSPLQAAQHPESRHPRLEQAASPAPLAHLQLQRAGHHTCQPQPRQQVVERGVGLGVAVKEHHLGMTARRTQAQEGAIIRTLKRVTEQSTSGKSC